MVVSESWAYQIFPEARVVFFCLTCRFDCSGFPRDCIFMISFPAIKWDDILKIIDMSNIQRRNPAFFIVHQWRCACIFL